MTYRNITVTSATLFASILTQMDNLLPRLFEGGTGNPNDDEAIADRKGIWGYSEVLGNLWVSTAGDGTVEGTTWQELFFSITPPNEVAPPFTKQVISTTGNCSFLFSYDVDLSTVGASNNINRTLPNAAAHVGKRIAFKVKTQVAGNSIATCTVLTSGGRTIDGESSFVLSRLNEYLEVEATIDGDWNVVAYH